MTLPQDVAGAELASEIMPGMAGVLMVSLMRMATSMTVEFSVTRITDDGLVPPRHPMMLLPGDVLALRRVAQAAAQVLQDCEIGDESVELARDDTHGLGAIAASMPDGQRWLVIAWQDGSGVAMVPLDDADAPVRVLVAAEQRRAELGLVMLAGELMN